jgi:hypothetical protein
MDQTLLISTLGALSLAIVHVSGFRLDHMFDRVSQLRWLSFAGGVSLSYVFLHLIPELEDQRVDISEHFRNILTLHSELVYLIALVGATLFFGLHRQTHSDERSEERALTRIFDFTFWISIGSFAVYNALITNSIHERARIDFGAVLIFILAMTMHFLVNDYAMRRKFYAAYQHTGRWMLALAILVGWLTGFMIDTGDVPFLIILAFLAGGTVIHVLSEELPEERGSSFMTFLTGAAVYSAVLLVL